jgi:uncharacterized Ntn-hydrolase superfamily protein
VTFSIVAADPATGDVGVAVASKFLAVGAVVPFARAGAGAVATQSWADVTFGPRGLDLLAAGSGPDDALAALLDGDDGRETRQVGIVAADGRATTFSGTACMDWAGGRVGTAYAAQGNILAGPQVVDAMATGFEQAAGQPLARRLAAALRAGDQAGGDRRGRQSAALLVARPGGGYGGNHDRYLDLRVDEHPRPVEELGRLLDLHRLYFDRPDPATVLRVSDPLRTELEAVLSATGRSGDPASFGKRLYGLVATENLEERWVDDLHMDPLVLEFLRGLDAND